MRAKRFIGPVGFDLLRVPATRSGAGGLEHHRLLRVVACVAVLCTSAAMAPAPASAVLPLPPAGTFTAVSTGGTTACALRTDQTIACWGDNAFALATPPSGTFTQLDVDDTGSACAVGTDKAVVCWGQSVGAVPPAGPFTSVAVVTDVACALRMDSTVTCWGAGAPGLAIPAGALTSLTATGAPGFCAVRPDATVACWGSSFGGVVPTGVAQVSGGGFGDCARLTDGTLACWGLIAAAPSGTFLSVDVGRQHACALLPDHTVACWGDNFFGETQPPGGTFATLAAGQFVSCGVRTDDTLVCWPGGAAAPGPPPPAAPAPSATAATPQSGVLGVGLPRLPAAFGTNGVFVLPSNRSCVSRRNFRIRIRRQRAGVTLVSAAVAVNGKRVAVRKGARLTAPVDLRGLPKGRFTVRMSALTADGRAISGTRRYHTCAPRRASGGHGPLVLAAALPGKGR